MTDTQFQQFFNGRKKILVRVWINFFKHPERLSVIGGLDYWNGLLEWTTGMDFDLFFFSSQELTIYIEELV